MENDRNINPYDVIDEYFENARRQQLRELQQDPDVDMSKRHTGAFEPKNIREFAKHMDARERAKNISNLCLGIDAIAAAAVTIYIFIDINLTLTKHILIYAAVMIAFALLINREKSKRAVIAYEVFAGLCLFLGLIFAGSIHRVGTDPGKMIFAYLPLAAQGIVGVFLYRCVWEFHEAWTAYRSSGNVPPIRSEFKDKAHQIDEWLKYR